MHCVREANYNDLDGILDLYKQLFPDEDYINPELYTEKWNEIITCKYIKLFIAEIDNVIVSTCTIVIIPNMTRGNRPYSIIENVITDKNNRNQGFGKEVIMKAIDYAKSNDCYKVMLLSSIKRTEAHSFYEKIGFNGNTKKGFEIRFIGS